MKKLLLTLAVFATLASCSKNEVSDVKLSNAISFQNLNDKVSSRAANDGSDDYSVYAKSTLDAENMWFIEDVIDGTTNKADKGIYYWPNAATIDFYSWAPATVPATVSTYGTLSITYKVPTTANEDFTIATPQMGKSSGTITFPFAHQLTKLTVSADMSQEMLDVGYTVQFNSATVGVISDEATINPMLLAPDWTALNSTGATYTNSKSYMIMPQATPGCSAQLKGVTISKGGSIIWTGDLKAYTFIADGKITNDKFLKGNHYDLKFTITAAALDEGDQPIFGNAIEFSADKVDWTSLPSTPIPQP